MKKKDNNDTWKEIKMTTVTYRAGFSSISCTFLRPSSLSKGEKLKNHIHNIEEIHKAGQNAEIHAKCVRQASVHKTEYKLDVLLDCERVITSAWCSCTSGKQAKCKHLGALIAAVNNERKESKTDQGCKWYKPSEKSRELYPKGRKFEEIFKYTPSNESSKNLTDQEKSDHLQLLNNVGDSSSMMYQLLTAQVVASSPATPAVLPEFVEEIFSPKSLPMRYMLPNGSRFSSEVSLLSSFLKDFYENCIQVDSLKSMEICRYYLIYILLYLKLFS